MLQYVKTLHETLNRIELLGLTRHTLLYRMEKYGIAAPREAE